MPDLATIIQGSAAHAWLYLPFAVLIGALTSAVVIGYTLNLLNDASTIYSKKAVPAGVIVPNVADLKETSTVKDSLTLLSSPS